MMNIASKTRIHKRSHIFAREIDLSLFRTCAIAIARTPKIPYKKYVALSPSQLPEPPNPHKPDIKNEKIARAIRANPARVKILGNFNWVLLLLSSSMVINIGPPL